MFWLYQSRWWNLLVRSIVPVTILLYMCVVYLIQDALVLHVRHTYRWAVAFGLMQMALLVTGITSIAVTKFFRERQDRIRAARIERIGELLAGYAVHHAKSAKNLMDCFSRWPLEFIAVLGSALHRVSGTSIAQLQQLAWKPEITARLLRESRCRNPRRVTAALNVLSRLPTSYAHGRIVALSSDPRNLVRMQARRLIIRYGSQQNQLDILNTLPAMESWERIQVFQQLSGNTASVTSYLRRSLVSADDQTLIAALDLIVSAQKFFDIPCPTHLVGHPNLEIRIRFFRALPFLASLEQAVPLVRRGLSDADWRVRSIAARAVGVLRISELGPQLIDLCTASIHGAEAGHAARALAALGGESWERLRRIVTAGGISGRQIADVTQRRTLARSTGATR